MDKVNARKIALDILNDIEENKAYSNISIRKHLRDRNISKVDRNLIRELVYGVLENKIYLDYGIRSYSKIRLKKIDKSILNVLRMSFYQLIYLDKIPKFAVVDEAVNMSKKINFKTKGFVNALLRNFIRNDLKISVDKIKSDEIEYLSVIYSHPQWLVERWLKEFGRDFTKDLLKANNETPKLTVRINTLKVKKDDLIDELKKEKIRVAECTYVEEGLTLEGVSNLDKLKAFKEGKFQVQDESSMLVSKILNPKAGDKILDVCSAPGGKATHMAQIMNNKGQIVARDIHEHKLKLIHENSNRLGINIIKTQKWDATNLDESQINKYDKVLVDAPCSGLGIIRRKPELKYNKTSEDISSISELQLEILNIASKYVKLGGTLLYSTCTIEKVENDLVVEKFLNSNKNFIVEKIEEESVLNLVGDNGFVKLYPNMEKTDGFFIAKLKKIT
ncbi:16S rRNA (cytosine(967)-C(5))-methyltransferase RsmB [Anaeromicrobium sediminis]|uniref:16S rRNA (cytosine(967)-C(5))-methyltransferase RsmB n=1 Tax=Anaeromicrobium sediminis TaxID=1478221 RepID=UPI001FA8F548|nr:16S rRNA (cytosine(967)-C(5))-methyltransferase RsmB [Anaeromicrobium sediminis]